jgi:putative GTP pyrophosphokinase
VNRAGQFVRRYLRNDHSFEQDAEALRKALGIILEYRAAHQYALAKATMGLRSMVKSEGCRVEVSQRLKRFATIADKLRREPTMALANMQDIGGARAVMESTAELRRVEQRLRKNRPPVRVADYIANPRSSGYRGVHVIVSYPDKGGAARVIEVQLRTQTMHEWAITVERMSGRLKEDLKSGYGRPEVLAMLSAISEAMAIEEAGETVSKALLDRMTSLRAAAVPYLGQ